MSKNDIKFYYDSNGKLIKQSNGLEFYYDAVGVIGVKYNNVTYFCRKDLQGNIIALIDNSGNEVVQYKYDAWGNHVVVDGNGNTITATNNIGNLNPFRYRGYYYDTETGLYFLKSRYYDPEVGRFINMDSIEYADPESVNGINLYAYCLDNPVNYIDPFGKFVISIGAVFGTFMVGLFALLAAPKIVEVTGDIADAIVDGIEGIKWQSSSGTGSTASGTGSIASGEVSISNISHSSIIKYERLALSQGNQTIVFSRERNRGHDSEFIGKTKNDLEKELKKAKSDGDTARAKRIIRELKIRGERNQRKKRGNPHMRGFFFLLLFDRNEERD